MPDDSLLGKGYNAVRKSMDVRGSKLKLDLNYNTNRNYQEFESPGLSSMPSLPPISGVNSVDLK